MGSTTRLRVAFISFDFGEYCVRLAGALAQHAEVLLVLPHHEVAPYASELNRSVRLFSFPKPRIRQVIRQFRTIRAILRQVRDFAPDVIHYQGIHLWFDLALALLREYPLVLTVHDFKPHPGDQRARQTPAWIERFARRRADRFIVHAQAIRRILVEELKIDSAKITVIPHIQIGEQPPAGPDEQQERLVLFFGRIWEYKGLEYLIRAEPLISAQVPDVQIVIAGQGEDFSRYARMMLHPERFIVDNQYISRERSAEYFRRASVVVLPYIEASQSGVIPMACSAAKPVVATTVGGLPEMVEHGRTGYLVPPRSTGELADAVVRLLLDPSLRREMGRNAKGKIEAECAPKVVAEKTLAVYREAVEHGASLSKASPIRRAVAALHPERAGEQPDIQQ